MNDAQKHFNDGRLSALLEILTLMYEWGSYDMWPDLENYIEDKLEKLKKERENE